MKVYYIDLSHKLQDLLYRLDKNDYSAKEFAKSIEQHFAQMYGLDIKVNHDKEGDDYYDFYIDMSEHNYTLFQLL